MDIRTRKGQQWRYVTEKVINDIGMTEGEMEGEGNMDGGLYESTNIGDSYHQNTYRTCHSGRVMQGFAHCSVTV